MRIGIGIDAWKLPIFERHLTQAGYKYTNRGLLGDSTALLLSIETVNIEAAHVVIRAANEECRLTGEPKS